MIKPKQDYMIVLKQEEKSVIHIPDTAKASMNMVPFKIVSIGPGRWEYGTFIPTTHKIGDLVFITGGIMETKHDDIKYLFAREKDVAAQLV